MSRPLERLVGMGLVRRETPFGEPPRRSRRSLYRIADPFFRLWFRVVAPQRAQLATADSVERRRMLGVHWDGLVSSSWEELCRSRLPAIRRFGRGVSFREGARWWRGNDPEWDVVSTSADGRQLLLGEVKWSRKPVAAGTLGRMAKSLAQKPAPPVGDDRVRVVRALFVPAAAKRDTSSMSDVVVVTAEDVLPREP